MGFPHIGTSMSFGTISLMACGANFRKGLKVPHAHVFTLRHRCTLAKFCFLDGILAAND